jgi:NADPH:quinone reductase-like Zn-dependent oxidoreductase
MLNFLVKKRITPVVDRIFPLQAAVAAHRHLLAAGQMGKAALRHG